VSKSYFNFNKGKTKGGVVGKGGSRTGKNGVRKTFAQQLVPLKRRKGGNSQENQSYSG